MPGCAFGNRTFKGALNLRTVKSTRGVSNQTAIILALIIPAIAIWLPFDKSSIWLVLGISAGCSLAILVVTLLLLPQRLVACYDDIGITDINTSLPYEKIDQIILTDCGRVTGWKMRLESDGFDVKPMTMELSQVSDAPGLLWSLRYSADRANNITRTTLFGSLEDWLVALLVTSIAVGLVHILFMVIA
jgi:hypothetical protein